MLARYLSGICCSVRGGRFDGKRHDEEVASADVLKVSLQMDSSKVAKLHAKSSKHPLPLPQTIKLTIISLHTASFKRSHYTCLSYCPRCSDPLSWTIQFWSRFKNFLFYMLFHSSSWLKVLCSERERQGFPAVFRKAIPSGFHQCFTMKAFYGHQKFPIRLNHQSDSANASHQAHDALERVMILIYEGISVLSHLKRYF